MNLVWLLHIWATLRGAISRAYHWAIMNIKVSLKEEILQMNRSHEYVCMFVCVGCVCVRMDDHFYWFWLGDGIFLVPVDTTIFFLSIPTSCTVKSTMQLPTALNWRIQSPFPGHVCMLHTHIHILSLWSIYIYILFNDGWTLFWHILNLNLESNIGSLLG